MECGEYLHQYGLWWRFFLGGFAVKIREVHFSGLLGHRDEHVESVEAFFPSAVESLFKCALCRVPLLQRLRQCVVQGFQDARRELLDDAYDSAFGTSFVRRFEFVHCSVNVFVGNRNGLVGLIARHFDAFRALYDALNEQREVLVRHRETAVSKDAPQQLGHQ
jgi:hypothetical protein